MGCRARRTQFSSPRRVMSFLRPEGASRTKGAAIAASGGRRRLFCDCTAVPFLQGHCNCASGGSSSQAAYPSPRRKRQVSSIALLVLSKQQTLRWFAVWSRFCLARKKYAKKRRRTRNSAYAQKNESLHFTCCRSSFRSPNALRATVESGFLSAR